METVIDENIFIISGHFRPVYVGSPYVRIPVTHRLDHYVSCVANFTCAIKSTLPLLIRANKKKKRNNCRTIVVHILHVTVVLFLLVENCNYISGVITIVVMLDVEEPVMTG
jgi:hypothetical protein